MSTRIPDGQRLFIVCHYGVTRNAAEVQRRFSKQWPSATVPHKTSITNLWEKFERTGSIKDDLAGNVGRPATAYTPENTERVKEYFRKKNKPTIRKCAAELNVNVQAVWRILHENLRFKAYKITVVQLLKEHDKTRRIEFAQKMLQKMDGHEIDPKKIWFTDECHVYLHGAVNKQNYRIWGSSNPYEKVERPLHPEYVTVWMGISAQGYIGPYFFDSTVTGNAYNQMLEREILPTLSSKNQVGGYWWQQNGATAHRTRDVKNTVRGYFQDRIIGLGFETEDGREITWPPYSPDLNPCDFFLWGAMKDHIFRQAPKTLNQIKNLIKNYAESLTQETVERVMDNFVERLRLVDQMDGNHFENII